MADKHAVQCSEETKAKLADAVIALEWTMPQVLELAADLVIARINGEETAAEKRTRLRGQPTSDTSATGVRSKSGASATGVGNGASRPTADVS